MLRSGEEQDRALGSCEPLTVTFRYTCCFVLASGEMSTQGEEAVSEGVASEEAVSEATAVRPVPPQLQLRLDGKSAAARATLKALASEPRTRILELLADQLLNVSEIADALAMPVSTATLHVNTLEDAGLLRTEFRPGERGLQKVCQRVYDEVVITLPSAGAEVPTPVVEVSMPVGAYVNADVSPTCGLAGRDGIIGFTDDPTSFYEPGHVDAQLIWFKSGFVEYQFPNRLPPQTAPDSLWLSLELGSEAPMHADDWPSDITVSVNGVELGIYTCPADFGGQRGLLTPEWWDTRNSQYGVLKEWRVTGDGAFVDGVQVSGTKIGDLQLESSRRITVRIAVKPDALNVGGVNLFGKGFGNYPQDIELKLRYR